MNFLNMFNDSRYNRMTRKCFGREFLYIILFIGIFAIAAYTEGKIWTWNKGANTKKQYCNVLDLTKPLPLEESLACRTTSGLEHVKMCPYASNEDNVISALINEGQLFEPEITAAIQKLMDLYPDAGLVDIGANIGTHALQIASLGKPVVAVEPVKEHIRRLHKAIRINNFAQQIVLLNNAVSSSRDIITMVDVTGGENRGAYLSLRDTSPKLTEKNPNENVACILMDDLLEIVTFKQCVVKMDIERHEPFALKKSARFFQEVDVKAIFMEWYFPLVLNRNFTYDMHDILLPAVLEMMDHLSGKGYSAFQTDGKVQLRGDWMTWPIDVVWLKHGIENV